MGGSSTTNSIELEIDLSIVSANSFVVFYSTCCPRAVKVRYYGLFAAGQRHRLTQARSLLVAQSPPEQQAAMETDATELGDTTVMLCPKCGQSMRRQKLKPLWPQAP